jgi:catechol 2,3-dioxygenase-like lactoylglutathione lyase family enzyme
MEARHPEGVLMAVAFNHTIIAARDKQASASFFTALFGLPEATTWGPFAIVTLADGVFVQFAEPNVAEIQMQHYAFLVDDERFDAIYGRIVAAGIDHAGDPRWTTPGQINTNHGGRGVYFRDPAGHGLEVITRPYGATA